MSKRIDIIDALRGLAIILMVIYHGLYDVVYYLNAPAWIFSNPIFDFLNRFFEVIFILLSGISCRLSRSNLKRGLIFWAGAIAVSVVTHLINNPIRFGILHFMGSAAILFGLYQLVRSRIGPRAAAGAHGAPAVADAADGSGTVPTPQNTAAAHPVPTSDASATPLARSASCGAALRSDLSRCAVILVCVVLFILGWQFSYGRVYETEWFFWLGMRYPGFYSSDWFPLIPWIFVYIAGTAIGLWVKERRLPAWFYEKKVPFFAAAGRKTLIIYLAHQPILFGITMLIQYIMK